MAEIAALLDAAKGGNGIVRATVTMAEGSRARLLLGQDYALDADLAMKLGRLIGDERVDLSAPPKMALVG